MDHKYKGPIAKHFAAVSLVGAPGGSAQWSKGNSMLSDVTTEAENHMVDHLQMIMVGGDSDRITSGQCQKDLDETLVFQKCMVGLRQALA